MVIQAHVVNQLKYELEITRAHNQSDKNKWYDCVVIIKVDLQASYMIEHHSGRNFTDAFFSSDLSFLVLKGPTFFY